MSVTRALTTASDPTARPTRPDGWKRAGWLAAAVLALVVYQSSLRVDCGPESGIRFAGPAVVAANDKRTIRIATFNIHGGQGIDGRQDLGRAAAALRGFDLVGLNEVHGHYAWEACDQAEWLGRELGTTWLFGPTEERWWHYRFGNAVLSKLPVEFWQRIPLPSRHGRSYRNVLLAHIDLHAQALNVVVTHFDRGDPRDRAEQWQAVTGLFLSLAEPAVLMGDLNTEETEPPLAQVIAVPGVRDPVREVLGGQTPRRIDWILTRGLRTVDAGMLDDGASDHPCVWAELTLEER